MKQRRLGARLLKERVVTGYKALHLLKEGNGGSERAFVATVTLYRKSFVNCCQAHMGGQSTKSTNSIVSGVKMYGPILLYKLHK